MTARERITRLLKRAEAAIEVPIQTPSAEYKRRDTMVFLSRTDLKALRIVLRLKDAKR